jgi:opacity protein-like surface antigen
MKKLVFLSILIFAFALTVAAQTTPIDKKSWFLGGSLYFQTQSGDLYKEGGESPSTINVAPSFGYFVAPGIFVGAEALYNNYKVGDNKETILGIGPTVGYYFNLDKARTQVKGAVYPYIKAFFAYASDKIEDTTATDYKSTGTSFGAMGGVNYMLSEAVALDFGVKFSSESMKQKEPIESDSFSGTTIQFGVGVTYFIWK